jgi:hypothetical protein
METIEIIEALVEKQIKEDKAHCQKAEYKEDTPRSVNEIYDDWYGQHQKSKGDAAFYAICELIGFMEDQMDTDKYKGDFQTINGIEVMPVKDVMWCLKTSLVCHLSGNQDSSL